MSDCPIITIPKNAKAREITSKKGAKLTVFNLSGDYEGYEVMFLTDWVTPCVDDSECFNVELKYGDTRTISKRERNAETKKWETVDSKELTAQELNALFERLS